MFFNPRSNIRLLHAVPDAPAVDVYIDNRRIASNLAFKNITDYIKIRPGRYRIEIYPAGERRNAVLRDNIYIGPRSISTVAVKGRLNNPGLLQISDPDNNPRQNTSYFRLVHLSPNAPAIDVKLNQKTIFRGVNYQNVTRYIPVDPKTYNINIFKAETENRVLRIQNAVLQSRFYYTLFVLGLVNKQPPLQGIIPLDGRYEFI